MQDNTHDYKRDINLLFAKALRRRSSRARARMPGAFLPGLIMELKPGRNARRERGVIRYGGSTLRSGVDNTASRAGSVHSDQLQSMRDWCKRGGLLVAKECVEPGACYGRQAPCVPGHDRRRHPRPSPFEAIVVHSLLWFFRDSIVFGSRKELVKHGVKVISITQQTSDDPSGSSRAVSFPCSMNTRARRTRSTSRAMRENASAASSTARMSPLAMGRYPLRPWGIGAGERRSLRSTKRIGHLRQIYALICAGHEGRTLGIKEIAKILERAAN